MDNRKDAKPSSAPSGAYFYRTDLIEEYLSQRTEKYSITAEDVRSIVKELQQFGNYFDEVQIAGVLYQINPNNSSETLFNFAWEVFVDMRRYAYKNALSDKDRLSVRTGSKRLGYVLPWQRQRLKPDQVQHAKRETENDRRIFLKLLKRFGLSRQPKNSTPSA